MLIPCVELFTTQSPAELMDVKLADDLGNS